jgi:ketosteroid isomerase-like protein
MLNNPAISPGEAILLELETKLARDVAARGGQAILDRMAPDAVMLMNGQAPLAGLEKISKAMRWTAKDYQMSWTPAAAMMSPSGDMGFSWGHYEGRSIDVNGFSVVNKGRYMTIWRKEKNGEWKIVLDAGADEPADAGDCCRVPKP